MATIGDFPNGEGDHVKSGSEKCKQTEATEPHKDNKMSHNRSAVNQPINQGSNCNTRVPRWDEEQELPRG